jgi:hypothetical protein
MGMDAGEVREVGTRAEQQPIDTPFFQYGLGGVESAGIGLFAHLVTPAAEETSFYGYRRGTGIRRVAAPMHVSVGYEYTLRVRRGCR